MVVGSNPPGVVDFPNLYINSDVPPGLGWARLRHSTHSPGKDVENSAVPPQNTWKGVGTVGDRTFLLFLIILLFWFVFTG